MTKSLSYNTEFGTEALLKIFICHKVGIVKAIERFQAILCVLLSGDVHRFK